jgi:hypothetical protein
MFLQDSVSREVEITLVFFFMVCIATQKRNGADAGAAGSALSHAADLPDGPAEEGVRLREPSIIEHPVFHMSTTDATGSTHGGEMFGRVWWITTDAAPRLVQRYWRLAHALPSCGCGRFSSASAVPD